MKISGPIISSLIYFAFFNLDNFIKAEDFPQKKMELCFFAQHKQEASAFDLHEMQGMVQFSIHVVVCKCSQNLCQKFSFQCTKVHPCKIDAAAKTKRPHVNLIIHNDK